MGGTRITWWTEGRDKGSPQRDKMSQKMGTSVLYSHGTEFSNRRNNVSKGPHAPYENAAS